MEDNHSLSHSKWNCKYHQEAGNIWVDKSGYSENTATVMRT